MKGYTVTEKKLHWWLASVVLGNSGVPSCRGAVPSYRGGVSYDHFGIEFSTAEKQVNSKALLSIRESVASSKGFNLDRVVVTSISYLGEMTTDEYDA